MDATTQGGCGCPYLRPNLLGGGSVDHDVQVGDVSDDTPHWEDFGQIPLQAGPHADREATSKRTERRMGIPPAGGRDGRGGIAGCGYLRLPLP